MATFLARSPWRVVDQLEAAGLDIWQASWINMKFTALVPLNVRADCVCTPEDEPCGENCAISWDKLITEDRSSPTLMQCLWDFICLDGAPEPTFMAFVARWGTPDWGEDVAPYDGDRPAWRLVDDIRRDALAVRRFLQILVATEEGTPVAIETLEELWTHVSYFDSDEDTDEGKQQAEARDELLLGRIGGAGDWLDFYEQQRARSRAIWRRWRNDERRHGHALAYQKRLVTRFLLGWSNAAFWVPSWQEGRRVVTAEVVGAKELVGALLRQIFEAPTLDVYSCSVCSRPFPFQHDEAKRRPRRGSGRFCGPHCAEMARRASNRASWQRNKERWRGTQPPQRIEGEKHPNG